MMDYPCGKLMIVVSTVLVSSDRQSGTLTDAAKHVTSVTVVNMSNKAAVHKDSICEQLSKSYCNWMDYKS